MILDRIIWGSVSALDLLFAVIIFGLVLVFTRILISYIRRMLKDRLEKDQLGIVTKAVSYSIVFLALLSILSHLGIRLSGMLLAGSVAGIIIGFAVQSIIGNFFSGIFMIIERPIKIGDQIEVEGFKGFVEDIRILSTTIRTYDGLYVRIPNQTMFTTKVTNFVGNIVRRFEYAVGIRYSDNADQAISIIREIVKAEPFALVQPRPQVFVDSLGDNAVIIIVRIWAPVSEWYDLKMKLLWIIKRTLEDNGIEIAFPQRTVWLAQTKEAFEIDGPKE